jgi:acetyltransferase-like isoleucine patch superfamily enzyme
MKRLIDKIKNNPALKVRLMNLMVHPVRIRPRLWLRVVNIFFIKRGKGSVICRSVRKDIVPYNIFRLGERSVIEDFSVINNMAGPVSVGKNSRIGASNTIIGPVNIGDNVIIAQNVVVSGLDHIYKNVEVPILKQGVETKEIVVGGGVWIGANSVITKGVCIGQHSVVAAGSVVTSDVADFTIVGGVPARVLKIYDKSEKKWVTPKNSNL